MFNKENYNPDVLTCLANLSSDEVFTSPKLANQMLDLLPKEIWQDKNARFLEPACKTGVFLREIASRLNSGLAKEIPNQNKRINHIFKNQLFGIAITDLTALITRRSVYCSKKADGKYSVCETFNDSQGNILFNRIEHTWKNDRCTFCGASQKEYDRGIELESHAYNFIHTLNPEEIFNMKFDVIIGNPPYQLSDGGGEGASAMPIYHNFIQQAIKLKPRYLTMIIPARWYSGGKGLDEFRNKILSDERMSEIHDFPETDLCFPSLNIRGGVCYFLWDSTHKGNVKVVNYSKTNEPSTSIRPLLEKGVETFIRYNKAISILQKVKRKNEENFGNIVHSRNVFGIPSNFEKFSKEKTKDSSILLYRSRRGSSSDKEVYVSKPTVLKNENLISEIKVLVSKVSPGGDEYPHAILTKPIVALPNSVCTETYLLLNTFKKIEEAENFVTYLNTRFFRFLVSLIKNTQNISKSCFDFVPIQNFSKEWSDEKLYKKYELTKEEITFIESMIRPMEMENE